MYYEKGKKRIGRFLSLLCILSLLAGCGDTAAQGTNTAEQPPAETTQTGDQTEQANDPGEADTAAGQYQVTEESDTDVKLPNQPISSFWFPQELLEWSAQADPDLVFNTSVTPLAERVAKEALPTVNATQNKDLKVVAISIMNSTTSGNPSQGTNRFPANTFSYWQYIDTLVYWGGSASEGLIVPPSADVTNAAHKNGVPVLGTIFFPPAAFGGKLEWLDTFLAKDENGEFPMIGKLIEVAQTYGFEGWFINQETEGDDAAPLKKEHAVLMQEWIKAFKAKAPELEIMWYDSMTKDGKMDWQNALTEENQLFMQDEESNPVADSMFLNFWWTNDKYAEQDLIKASAEKAAELAIDPFDVYAGVDVQAEGILTPVKWELFEEKPGNYYTSLGLYCPSWTYFSATDVDDFQLREKAFWVNKDGDPTAEQNTESGWRGISSYAVEQTVVQQYPFKTNFSIGNGYSYFINGEKVSLMDWNDRSLAGIMPTYRYIFEHEGNNKLSAGLDFSSAWNGGNSLKIRGDLEAQKASLIKLYSADLTLEENTQFTVTARAGLPVQLNLVLDFADGSRETISADSPAEENWKALSYDVSPHTGKAISTISLQLISDTEASGLEVYLGEMAIRKNEAAAVSAVTELTADTPVFDEDQMYAGVRLVWNDSADSVNNYEIFRINEDGTRTFLGATISKAFYANVLPRVDKVLTTQFEVIGIGSDGVRGTPATAEITWPDNALPQAKLTASRTLTAPGTEITFSSLSSANTETLSWEFPGADVTESTEANPVVTYSEEGVYSVKLTASNESGESVKEELNYIIITKEASGDLLNLSEGKNCEATAYVNDNEAPPFALDGKTETKWCATGTPPHSITIDLGEVTTLSQVQMAHAEAGGESPDMNTLSYTIEVSQDNVSFQEVVQVTRNSLANTSDAFAPVNARFVRVNIKKPTQGSDTAARIYEIQVFGLAAALESAASVQ